MAPRIAIVAGELSGDRLGAGLISAVHRELPDCQFEGVAGPQMIAAGCEPLYKSEALAVMGLTEVLRHLPRLLGIRRRLLRRWRADPPDLFIGIDAPDFNIGLELKLKRQSIPVVHYVCPSIWAWRQGRVKKIRRAVDRVLCLLPFEKDFLIRHNVAASFVGHPLADQISPSIDRAQARRQLELGTGPVVAILPGSRVGEVGRLGEEFLRTAAWLQSQRSDLTFVAAMASDEIVSIFSEQKRNIADDLPVRLVNDRAHTVLAAADVVLIASGTATLEAALLKCPMVVAYRLSPLTFRLVTGLKLLKINQFSLPNLLTGRRLVPEYIQSEAVAANLGPAVLGLIEESSQRREMCAEFDKLHSILARDADQRAAAAVLALLKEQGVAGDTPV